MPGTKKEGKKFKKCCLQAVVLPDRGLVTNFRPLNGGLHFI